MWMRMPQCRAGFVLFLCDHHLEAAELECMIVLLDYATVNDDAARFIGRGHMRQLEKEFLLILT